MPRFDIAQSHGQPTDADRLSYQAETPGNWTTPPKTVQEAIDLLAGGGGGGLPGGGSLNQILRNSGPGTGAWGTVTEDAGALDEVASIRGPGAINLYASDDTDDYLQFLSSGTVPGLKTMGGDHFTIESNDASITSARFWRDADHYLEVGFVKASNVGFLSCKDALLLCANGDETDCIKFQTIDDVPEITTEGSCNLKITSSGGTIDFADDDLTTLGSITAASLALDTDLVVDDGGTGASSFTDGGVLVGNGSNPVQVTTAGTAGQILTSNGAGVDPTFQDLAAKFRRRSFTFHAKSIITDEEWLVGYCPDAFTIAAVYAKLASGSGNLNIYSRDDPSSSTGQTTNVDAQGLTSSWVSKTLASGTVAAGQSIVLKVTSASAATECWVTVYGTVN